MQQDVYCVLAAELAPKIVQTLEKRSTDADAQKVKATLSQWNFEMNAQSPGACL
jgi:acyl-homoserine lactone acylase PvdQ